MTKLCKNCKHFCEFHIDGFVDSFCDRPIVRYFLVNL